VREFALGRWSIRRKGSRKSGIASTGSREVLIMEPNNDHEQVIARAVDEKILEDPGDSHHTP